MTLASRCSVHCKSDATHKLNKGECMPADIACSLIAGLATRVARLIAATGWRHERVLSPAGSRAAPDLSQSYQASCPRPGSKWRRRAAIWKR